MVSALDVARYFVASVDEDAGELISHLKLQKLCYYAQGFHLALFDVPLFPEKIEAWQHGPVVPEVWHQYKQHGSGAIPRSQDFESERYDQRTKDLLDEIHDVYGQYSAWKLRNMTHEEPPWRDAPSNGEISQDSMKAFFKTLVVQPA